MNMTQIANNIDVFNDTLRRCQEDGDLSESVRRSKENQFVLLESDKIDVSGASRFSKPAEVSVSKRRTFQAARGHANGSDRVCVLNFANSFNPGGGVENGATAQEECLCRCSTLYSCISDGGVRTKFHDAHRAAFEAGKMSLFANDDCIFTPDVVVFKSDELFPKPLDKAQWFNCDVITCAAPQLPFNVDFEKVISKEALFEMHSKRGKRIFELAKSKNVDRLVLGAFGCGAFANPPEIVAAAYKLLVEEFRRDFKAIEFAVYCKDGEESANYKAFRNVM